MKQKRIGDILYVFDVTPYTISEDTDASIIKVQQEAYEGFVELNPDLTDKIVKYNYHMFTVNQQEWAPYVDAEEPAATYTITMIGDSDMYGVNIAGYNGSEYGWVTPSSTDSETYTITWQYPAGLIFEVDEREVSITEMNPECQIDSDPEASWDVGTSYIMPNSDVTITVLKKHNIYFTEDSNAGGSAFTTADVQIDPNPSAAGETTYVRFLNGYSSSTIEVTSEDVELTYDSDNDEYQFIMPAHDIQIKAVYTQPIEVSIDFSNTDLTYNSSFAYDQSATYYPHAFFVVNVGDGKTTDDYTFVKSSEAIRVDALGDHFDIEFSVGGTLVFTGA